MTLDDLLDLDENKDEDKDGNGNGNGDKSNGGGKEGNEAAGEEPSKTPEGEGSTPPEGEGSTPQEGEGSTPQEGEELNKEDFSALFDIDKKPKKVIEDKDLKVQDNELAKKLKEAEEKIAEYENKLNIDKTTKIRNEIKSRIKKVEEENNLNSIPEYLEESLDLVVLPVVQNLLSEKDKQIENLIKRIDNIEKSTSRFNDFEVKVKNEYFINDCIKEFDLQNRDIKIKEFLKTDKFKELAKTEIPNSSKYGESITYEQALGTALEKNNKNQFLKILKVMSKPKSINSKGTLSFGDTIKSDTPKKIRTVADIKNDYVNKKISRKEFDLQMLEIFKG